MNHMETVQHHIEITRQQIIHQLTEELANFQRECLRLSQSGGDDVDILGHRIYHRIIASKLRLIERLSATETSPGALNA